jgi:hypothetical protein
MDFIKEVNIENKVIGGDERQELEEAITKEISFEDILRFDDIDITKQSVPLFITLIEKIIKNTLTKYSGKLPSELAALYCSYILMAIYKIDEITSKIIYFNKKSEAEVEYTMAQEKTKAVVSKESEASRERWVQENSSEYKQKKDYQYKTYSILKYFESKQKSLDKIYYLCKTFISDTQNSF